MPYEDIENPLYVESTAKLKDYTALPYDDAGSSTVVANEIYAAVGFTTPKRRTWKRIGWVLFVIFMMLLSAFIALNLNNRYRLRLNAVSCPPPFLVGRRSLPNSDAFEALVAAYVNRVVHLDVMDSWRIRRLAEWWRSPAASEMVNKATVWDAEALVEVLIEFYRFQRKQKGIFAPDFNSLEDYFSRFANFLKNHEEIQRLNRIYNTTFGVNHFADWTDEEFRASLLPIGSLQKRRNENTFVREMNPVYVEMSVNDYPERWDWREKGVVTPVKNQGKCGSCWAFATAATVESAYAVAHGELRSLSEQELLDCNLANNACNGGDCDKAFRYVHEHGLMYEDAYPYLAQRQNTCRLTADSETTKIDVAYFIHPDEKSIIDWLVNFGPVNIGISVPADMKPYTGGVYRPSDYDCKFRVVGEHALLIVGYGTTEFGEKYWIVKNSWGDKWGIENGYVNFARGVNACGIENDSIGILA